MFVCQRDYSPNLELFQGINRRDCMPFMFAPLNTLLLSLQNARALGCV